MRSWFGSLASALVLAMGCGGDDSGSGTEGEDSSGSGSSGSASMTTAGTAPTTMTTTNGGSADGTGTTGPDPDTGTADATTAPGTTTGEPGTGTTAADGSTGGEGSSSGGQAGADYPACTMDDECSEPYTLCWPPMKFGVPNFCTLECVEPGDCPVPSTGTAVPVCEGPPGTDICVLDCTKGDCPDGMTCTDVFNDGTFMRCTNM